MGHARLIRVNLQGGTLIFSSYVGSGQASIFHQKKISGISSTPKKYLKFKQAQKISPVDPSLRMYENIRVPLLHLGVNQG